MLARPIGVDRRDDQVVLCTTLKQKKFLISLTIYISISMCRLSAALFAMTKFGLMLCTIMELMFLVVNIFGLGQDAAYLNWLSIV